MFAPRGVMASSSSAPLQELCVEDFGRFASKYYTVRSITLCTGANGEIERRPFLREGEALPSKLKPMLSKLKGLPKEPKLSKEPKPLRRKGPSTPRIVSRASGAQRSPLGQLAAVTNAPSPVRLSAAPKKGTNGIIRLQV